jgi:hypothetical protein
MRTLSVLVALFLLFSGWQYLRRHQNERRLALVASELAQREVGVGCPGFWTRLVEITPYAGWVSFDEHGRPADETQLSAATCRSLERLWRAGEPPSFSCLVSDTCPRSTLELVDGIVTLAHESWHLRGVVDEAQTQCYAVQSTERAARLFGIRPADAHLIALSVAAADAAAPQGEYHSPECRPGGRYDLAPHTFEWP